MDREHPADAAEVRVRSESIDVPWAEYGDRLEEVALADLQARFDIDPNAELASLFAGALDQVADAAGDGDDRGDDG
jgi:hypothetical protein